MKKYLLKRAVYIIVVFFIVSVMMYAIYNLIPTDPAMVQMEPLRRTLKPDVWKAQYEALREELGLDAPILLRYARWMGFAKRKVTEFHFIQAQELKAGKRYLLAYENDGTTYVLSARYAGTGNYAETLPMMIPVNVNGNGKLEITSADYDKYGKDVKKYLFNVEGNKKDGWAFKSTLNNFYLTLDAEERAVFMQNIAPDSFEKWEFDAENNLKNKKITGDDKYLTFGTAEKGIASDNYLAVSDTAGTGFKFYEIKDMGFNGMLQGNFGYSINFKRNVTEVIGTPMLNSILLNFGSELLALAVTIPLGIYCAVHARKPMDTAIQTITVIGYSLPSFLTAILFIYIFAVILRIFPVGGAKTPGANFTGAKEFADRMYYMALPMLTLLFMSLAYMTRMVRASMLDSLSQDYIRTARAKGLKEKVVIYSHAWRNALLPVSTSIIGGFIGIFTGGALIIENLFSLNGLGKLYYNALMTSDFELVLALQMFYELIALLGVLVTDISYTLIDPRVRIEK